MNKDNLSAGDWFFGVALHMGANWKTTLSGLATALSLTLTMLASLSYGIDSPLTNVLPPKVKGFVATVGIFSTAALHVWNAIQQKSKNVTGGSVQQTLTGDQVPGTQTLVDITKQSSIVKP
jgi:hypothetical protein